MISYTFHLLPNRVMSLPLVPYATLRKYGWGSRRLLHDRRGLERKRRGEAGGLQREFQSSY